MITKIEGKDNPPIILGKIFIYDISLHSLNDSSTTHYFASLAYVEKLGKLI